MNSDITIVYYTANAVRDSFGETVRRHLLRAAGDAPLISVSQHPMDFGMNICIGGGKRSHLNIYRQALMGAKQAKTKYIGMAEDDILYSIEHFKLRPKDGVFGYDFSFWSLYTWTNPPIFSYKDRRNLGLLICERDLFIEAMEERFAKFPKDADVAIKNWAEPGKYEHILKVTQRETEKLYTKMIPSVMFSHEEALSFEGLGTRKKLGELKVTAIPYWGSAEEVREVYA